MRYLVNPVVYLILTVFAGSSRGTSAQNGPADRKPSGGSAAAGVGKPCREMPGKGHR